MTTETETTQETTQQCTACGRDRWQDCLCDSVRLARQALIDLHYERQANMREATLYVERNKGAVDSSLEAKKIDLFDKEQRLWKAYELEVRLDALQSASSMFQTIGEPTIRGYERLIDSILAIQTELGKVHGVYQKVTVRERFAWLPRWHWITRQQWYWKHVTTEVR